MNLISETIVASDGGMYDWQITCLIQYGAITIIGKQWIFMLIL
jgi:hypothetical protein